MKLTDWFPPEVKPVHVGVYETQSARFMDDTWYAYFDGKRWGYCTCTNPEDAFEYRNRQHFRDSDSPWRGLAEKPE